MTSGSQTDKPRRSLIRVICQFCGKHYGDKPGLGVIGDSHGVCPECVVAPRHQPCGFPQWYCDKMRTCAERELKARD
jgi:hypothetical protein